MPTLRRRWAAVIVALAALVATAIVAAGVVGITSPPDAEARRTVSVSGRPWDVLLAGRDGMRGRTGFDGADGMLFDVDQDVDPGAVLFVMDGVSIPLDIAWFSDDGVLVGTASMVPCPAELCPRYRAPGRFRWAIEAPPGAFAELPADATLEVGTGP